MPQDNTRQADANASTTVAPSAAATGPGATTGALSSVMPTYSRQDVTFDRGEGAWLFDSHGQRYLDFGSGIAVNALGHAHPRLVDALCQQAHRLWHTSNLYKVAGQERLAQRLCDVSFADVVFFCNSGAEACEGAIKTARGFHAANGHPERWRTITFEGAFHGRTLATLAAGRNPKHMDGFGPPADGFDQVAFGDHDALKAAIGPETAAIMVEPIQGEGGIRSVPDQCLRGLRELCNEHGLLLIFDEVQTGVGRTGHLFAHEAAGIAPDIMAIAKGIGGGFPLGAIMATRHAASGMQPGTHGSTFGGNPLAMAVANALLDVVLEPGFLDEVNRLAAHLGQSLGGLLESHADKIEQVRGRGLLRGLKLSVPVGEIVAAAAHDKLLVVPAGDNVLRVLPPLNVTDEEIAIGLERLSDAIASVPVPTPGQ